jgi:hypothetical protein
VVVTEWNASVGGTVSEVYRGQLPGHREERRDTVGGAQRAQ